MNLRNSVKSKMKKLRTELASNVLKNRTTKEIHNGVTLTPRTSSIISSLRCYSNFLLITSKVLVVHSNKDLITWVAVDLKTTTTETTETTGKTILTRIVRKEPSSLETTTITMTDRTDSNIPTIKDKTRVVCKTRDSPYSLLLRLCRCNNRILNSWTTPLTLLSNNFMPQPWNWCPLASVTTHIWSSKSEMPSSTSSKSRKGQFRLPKSLVCWSTCLSKKLKDTSNRMQNLQEK